MAMQQTNPLNPGRGVADNTDDRFRVLIIDDEPAPASYLKSKLSDPKYPVGRLRLEIDVAEDIVTAREYLCRDCIDIYFIDLIMYEKKNDGVLSESVGKSFVQEVAARTNAGVIVYSNMHERTQASDILHDGADDYIEKLTYDAERISARVCSVWRRVKQTRHRKANALSLAHTGRTFQIGKWRFVIGSRVLKGNGGETLRISPTEYAFLKYICVVEDHIIDADILNLVILERKEHEKDVRVDSLVYRLRNRLGEDNIRLSSLSDTAYKLVDFQELKPSVNS